MRIVSAVERLELAPGASHSIPVEFHNGTDVIESASVRVVGLPAEHVSCEPSAVALFPDAVGHIAVTLRLPDSFPAGVHPVTLFVSGIRPGHAPARHDLELIVPAQPEVRVTVQPRIVRARRRGTFTVIVANQGNSPLDVALTAGATDRQVSSQIAPSTLSVPIGASVASTIIVKGPRQLLGGDQDRELTVTAQSPDAEDSVLLVLRQRPTFSRGLITVLVLAGIVLLWALAFMFGIRQALATDPFHKVAPASFFAGQVAPGQPGAGVAPVGAMPKDGAVPAGVGSAITGTVRGSLDNTGLGRMRVDVMRQGRDEMVQVASTATLTDGTYSVPGLMPGSYYLRFRADGYDTVWSPDASSRSGAKAITVGAQKDRAGVDVAMVGDPASLTGLVKVPSARTDSVVTVTAVPTWSEGDPVTHTVDADASGRYTFTDLPAPGTYEVTFSAPGLQPATSKERVLGGQDRFALDIALGAGTGSVSGIVTDGSKGLGGAILTTTVAGKQVAVGTPTTGQIGAFTLGSLPTPATYVLTVTKEGFSTRRVVVDLEAGENRGSLTIPLAGGAGTVTGVVAVDDGSKAGGNKLGGVKVTLEGAMTPRQTSTLTGGQIGSFTLTGLTSPGQHTLTFELEGYQSVSLPVTLTADQPARTVNVKLASARGTLTGQVMDAGGGANGITVQVTDGTTVRSTVSARSSGKDGAYTFAGLPAGNYTVTALRATTGATTKDVVSTGVVTVSAGRTTSRNLSLVGGG